MPIHDATVSRHCTFTYADKRLNHVAVLSFDSPLPGGSACPDAHTPIVLEHVAELVKIDPAYAAPSAFNFHPAPPELRAFLDANPDACSHLTPAGLELVRYLCGLGLVTFVDDTGGGLEVHPINLGNLIED